MTMIVTAQSPLAVRGLHDTVVNTLGSSIVTGDYKPGDRIMPDDLGGSYGVSRTVMREAMRVLQAKGLISARPNVGTMIRPVEEWNLLDADVLRWRATAKRDERLDADIRLFTEMMRALHPALEENPLYRQLLATLGITPEPQTAAEADKDADDEGTEADDSVATADSPVTEWVPSLAGPDAQGSFVANAIEAAAAIDPLLAESAA